MSAPSKPRPPQAFATDDPAAHKDDTAGRPADDGSDMAGKASAEHFDARTAAAAPHGPRLKSARKGLRWGGILLSAVAGLTMLAMSAWVMRFVTTTLAGDDWIAWAAFGLLCVAGIAMAAIALREIAGIMRLRKLAHFRTEVEGALAKGDRAGERNCVKRLKALYVERPDMRWSLARFGDHEQDIFEPGDLLTLAERDLIVPLDTEARFAITAAAKKVSLVTAISPIAILDVLFVLSQNLSLLRQLATLYGARPGLLGGLRLAKLVAAHIIATGGLALTDDLIGQILGHDFVRRLSQRIGEGVFNGALTARIGIAAIEILRPLPYIEAKPLRLRDLVPVIFKKNSKEQGR